MQQEKGEIRLDLLPFVARAIAEKPAARRELGAIYADSRIIIEKAPAKSVEVYKRYYRESNVLAEIDCQKATDLILTASEQDDNGKLARTALKLLLKQGWPHLYAHVQVSGQEVPFEPFWHKLLDNGEKAKLHELRNLPNRPPSMSATTKNALDGEFPILWFLVNLHEKTFTKQGSLFQQFFNIYVDEQERINKLEKPIVLIGNHQQLADTLWQAVEKKLRGISVTLNDYFNTIFYKGKAKKYLFNQNNFSGLPIHSLKHVIVSRKELRNAIDSMAATLPADTVVSDELKQEALALFPQVLLLRACAAEYEKLRTHILQSSRLDRTKQSKSAVQGKKLKLELVEAQKNMLALEKSLAEKQDILNELQLKLDKQELAAQKEKVELEERLADVNQVLDKLLAARQQESETVPDLDQAAIEQVARLKVIIIGGRSDWQQRLREKYPNFSFIASEDVKYDLTVLEAADAIVIHWRNLGHSLFYRTVNYAGKLNKKIVYFGNSNEKHLLWTLHRECILPIEKKS